MNKKTIGLFIAVAALFAVIGVAVGNQRNQAQSAKPNAVERLYAQSLTDAGGTPQKLSQWKGKPLVVNFWATWCAPCVEEMPELSALQKELAGTQAQIIGIGIDSPSNIRDFAAKYQISYPLYIGGMEASELSRQLGNQAGGLPFTVLIREDGSIRKTFLGRLKMTELRAELARR
ncbi:TlpA disulfide reductase family protein [Noviherbaspirillum galbum]|uniref:TlpA family protein disulfide reductase n=1 Tax=Noviherbaspirillum galbum TaxID=2709383 RepID=A0A6B3SXU9_9BURK|nr:TlpA disulfide reductase family protein [Noviherbaspirillum galbum]NEX64445.1 TlpA family protein disulfide reductase [Noviherbaspirillum galbum]